MFVADSGCRGEPVPRALLGFVMRPDVRAELADIRCPVLVVAGGVDEETPVGKVRNIQAFLGEVTARAV
jgi:pimeloyl-ACP methyl ester carboxylesterase